MMHVFFKKESESTIFKNVETIRYTDNTFFFGILVASLDCQYLAGIYLIACMCIAHNHFRPPPWTSSASVSCTVTGSPAVHVRTCINKMIQLETNHDFPVLRISTQYYCFPVENTSPITKKKCFPETCRSANWTFMANLPGPTNNVVDEA